MKIASLLDGNTPTFGLVTGTTVQVAGPDLLAQYPDLRAVLAVGALDRVAAKLKAASGHPAASLRFLPVIPHPARILCVGINYLEHIHEMGREKPDYPTLFTRYPDSLVGHGEAVVRPAVSTEYDYEGELAIVIGRPARNVRAGEALDHVAGYTGFFDGSVRDWQRHTSQFIPGKNFPATGGVGPWLVTTDEIPDPGQLTLETRVNGEILQRAPISDLCFGVARIVEYCSTFCELNPGDIIATGTPSGVGFARTPPRWLVPGDRVEVEITDIGTLRHDVVAEAPHS